MTTNIPKIVGVYCILRAIIILSGICVLFSYTGTQFIVVGPIERIAYLALFCMNLGSAFVLVVIATGLFKTKPWAWMGTILYFGIESFVAVWTGLTISRIVFLVIAAAILYIFSSDPVKQVFGKGR
ncbi:MAG: hypothetical protein K8I60_02640 [Anaerolineae bacterium]|nr:hypothetical protein [Anaerolineae bacterium]